MTKRRELFAEYQALELEMHRRLEQIVTAKDLSKFLEDYLDKLAGYRELHKQSVDDYLFILAGYLESPAIDEAVSDGSFWQSLGKILIYNIDRE